MRPVDVPEQGRVAGIERGDNQIGFDKPLLHILVPQKRPVSQNGDKVGAAVVDPVRHSYPIECQASG